VRLGEGVALGRGVGLTVAVGVRLGEGVALGTGVGLTVAVGVRLGEGVALGRGVGLSVAVGVRLGEGVALGRGVGLTVAVGVPVLVARRTTAVGCAEGDGASVGVWGASMCRLHPVSSHNAPRQAKYRRNWRVISSLYRWIGAA
jgi:hypothetical protein